MAFVRTLHTGKVVSLISLCALLAGAGLGLGGCDDVKKTEQAIDRRAGEAQQSLDSAKRIQRAVVYDPLVVTNKVWSGNAALRMQRGMPLPARYEVARGVTLVSSEPMSIEEIAVAIGEQTGIPVRLTSLSLAGKSAPATPAPAAAGPLSSALSSSGTSNTPRQTASALPLMPISYEGPLSGLLERISAYYGVSWRYDGSALSVSRYDTRIFAVESLPGSQVTNEGLQDDTSSSSGGSSSSSGSGSSSSSTSQNTLTQNSKTTMDLKYWDELAAVLTSIVGKEGSVIVSPTMGTVTVTTTSEVMATVSDYMAKENRRQSRQIAINVQIYSVNMGQSQDYSVAFTGFLKNLASMQYTSAAAPGILNNTVSSGSMGSFSIAILNNSGDPKQYAGDILKALSTIGNATTVAQFPMTTLNNHPVSRRVGTDTAYIASVTQNTTTSTSSSTILTPIVSTIHDGFSLQLTPRLLDDGRILLQYSLSLIGLDTLGTTTFQGLPLSLPVTDNRLFVQQSMLRSGQTLMIGGVDQEKLSQNKNGVGSPDNFLLGGGVSSNNNHLMVFMAITPQVMDDMAEEHN